MLVLKHLVESACKIVAERVACVTTNSARINVQEGLVILE